MTKRQVGKRGAKLPPPDFDRTLRDLRRFYEIGSRSLDRHAGRMPYGKTGGEAAGSKLHPEMLRKARAFAKAYSERQLNSLIALCRRHRHALGLSHVIRLLTVPAEARDALQEAAVVSEWGAARLDVEIMRRCGKRRNAGRRRAVPSSGFEACYQIARAYEHWRRMHDALSQHASKRGKAVGESALLKVVPADLRGQVTEADRAMRRLFDKLPKKVKAQDKTK
jgi:hypothetical protein